MSDALVFTEADMERPSLHHFEAGSVAAFSSRCPDRVGPNEDAAAVVPLPDGRLVLVVADGCGGHRAGEAAARTAVEAVRELDRTAGALRSAVLDAIERASVRIGDMKSGAATTLAVAGVEAGSVRAFHAGDSVVLLVGQRGRRKLETLSHAPVARAVEAGLLDETEALHHEDRALVSNVVGAEDMRIEVGPSVTLAPRDTLLLATDGLFDNLSMDEVIDVVRRGPLPSVARDLAEAARQRMLGRRPGLPAHPDDLTFLVFRPAAAGRRSRARPPASSRERTGA